MRHDLAPDQPFSHYRIIARLGAGGMGDVYLAEDAHLRRKVALKVLPEALARDRDRLRRFEQEALSASALNHPGILTIYEFGVAGDRHFLASEFVDGETLRARLDRGPMSTSEVLEVALAAARALAAAHEARIVHRDIKPENLMLRKDGIVKVLDFGLAKLVEPDALGAGDQAQTLAHTDAGVIQGTAAYMSPEQASGQPVDARTDLFSLGVVLYEMLTRRQPFTGGTISHVIVAIVDQDPPPLGPGVPDALAAIVLKLLAKRPEARYQHAQELVADLQRAQLGLLMGAVPGATSARPFEREAPASAERRDPPPSRSRRWLLASLPASLLIVGGGTYLARRLAPAHEPVDSLAVLPFQNRGDSADSEYLSDGLAESLIYRLSQLPHVRVSPTSSVFRYKGSTPDPATVAHELDVRAVMTGRILQRGDTLIISVELVDVSQNKTLWGDQYERKMADLLGVQREMANEIAQRLQLKLSGQEAQTLAKTYTASNEAYQLYLQGRYHWARRTKDEILTAIETYRKAIAVDPAYALAYAAIADCYNSMGKDPDVSPTESIPYAKAAALKALELDAGLAEAHAALADSLAIYDWNWTESEREFRRAIELNPNVSYSHLAYATSYLAAQGRAQDMVDALTKALALEPLSLINNSVLVTGYLYARQNDRALEQARKALGLDARFLIARHWAALANIANARYADAIAIGEGGLMQSPEHPEMLFVVGQAYATQGRRREAESYLERLRAVERTRYVRTYWSACILAALGDTDAALAALERSLRDRDIFLPRARIDPMMDPLRDEPRFTAILARMGLRG